MTSNRMRSQSETLSRHADITSDSVTCAGALNSNNAQTQWMVSTSSGRSGQLRAVATTVALCVRRRHSDMFSSEPGMTQAMVGLAPCAAGVGHVMTSGVA